MIKAQINGDNQQYILIGAGYGMFKSQGQGGWGSLPSTTKGDARIVALCNNKGVIVWAKSEDVTIISIDDKLISNLI